MENILLTAYPWIKSLHVISVIAWMAGIFYLPRLFVRHTESVIQGSDTDLLFQDMERKLLKIIMTPAMMSAWFFGILLVSIPGVIDWSAIWPWIKAACVITMTWFHFWCSARRKEFQNGQNTHSGKYFRQMNEVPTLLMMVIIFMVIARPF